VLGTKAGGGAASLRSCGPSMDGLITVSGYRGPSQDCGLFRGPAAIFSGRPNQSPQAAGGGTHNLAGIEIAWGRPAGPPGPGRRRAEHWGSRGRSDLGPGS